jgi:hypothetical protein
MAIDAVADVRSARLDRKTVRIVAPASGSFMPHHFVDAILSHFFRATSSPPVAL